MKLIYKHNYVYLGYLVFCFYNSSKQNRKPILNVTGITNTGKQIVPIGKPYQIRCKYSYI